MEPVYLFSLASRQNSWLSVRQSTISENIANVDTPGFASKDVEPFKDVLDKTSMQMAATQSGHISETGSNSRQVRVDDSEAWQVTVSDNSVSLEQELIKAGEVTRQHSLNTQLVGSFYSMMKSSLGR
ncbi:flagellar basal body rod protein FlgB [Pseudovibrio sp. Tun.PSC04-5.I4]|uniref:flagellar basal body rod protein FlgB n=1 Tax=Pseudovibrio sp. Tun.PSC04-5.I4 TaxID=1798213 RepID=UPI0008873CD7|nr:flagellar basal body rod protein FlgB [Pseudovibrio sp. Tun.PSC04-5.I4]SDQ92440.1 flagellar basal-body rod protein FlgB [Pseudovibrio sp. Tun.PSC04-5.I4]